MAESFPIPPFQNAMVREAAVDETMVPQDSVELSLNLHFDRIGAVERRLGITPLGTQLVDNTPILGMGFFRNNAGTTYGALAKVGTVVKAYLGSSWADVRTGLTASSKARFTNFVDYVFMVNGTGNEVLSTWNGSGNFGATNDADLPKGDFIENYRSRIWVAQATVDKVYYSDVVNTDNTITGGASFIQISPNDGEKITGLKRHPRALLVFKQNHIYRIFSTNSTDPDPSIFRGTYSQESIVEAKDGIHYHHPTGFYKFVFDGEQEEISRPIIDVIKAIPRTAYENIAGWADDDHIYWSIGDITLRGVTLQNVVCRRTISTKAWTLYSYPNEFRSSTLYDDGTDLFYLIGDTDGNVMKHNVGNDDNGSPIFYDLITHWMYLTANQNTAKTISELVAMHEDAAGSNVAFQVDQENQGDDNNAWKPIGKLNDTLATKLSCDAKNFTRIRFRVFGSSSGTPFLFRSFEILDLST